MQYEEYVKYFLFRHNLNFVAVVTNINEQHISDVQFIIIINLNFTADVNL